MIVGEAPQRNAEVKPPLPLREVSFSKSSPSRLTYEHRISVLMKKLSLTEISIFPLLSRLWESLETQRDGRCSRHCDGKPDFPTPG